MTNNKQLPVSNSLEDMTKLYNSMVPKDKQVKKFRDKKTAQARLTEVMAKGNKVKPPMKSDSMPLQSKTNVKPSNILSPSSPKRVTGNISEDSKNITLDLTVTESRGADHIIKLVGKKSNLAGKFLYKKVNKNPRRPGSHGYLSFEALRDGMTYEQFILAKGGAKHLHWDIEHGFVEALDKPRTAEEKSSAAN